MTPLIKSITKYAVMIFLTAILFFFVGKSCNSIDTSYYDNQISEATKKISELKQNDEKLTDSLNVLKSQNTILKKDSAKVVEVTKQLIAERRTNYALRQLIASKDTTNNNLTDTELDTIAIDLAECAGLRKLYNNVLNQNEVLEFKARGLEDIISLKDLTIESLENKVKALDPAWYDSFSVGAITVIVFELIIATAFILLQ